MEGTTRIGDKFNVGGVLLERPFKIRRFGPFRLQLLQDGRGDAFLQRPARLPPHRHARLRAHRAEARHVRRRADHGRLVHDARHRPPLARASSPRRRSTAWAAAAPAAMPPTPRSRPTRSPGRSARCARSATASTGSSRSASIPAASAATCRARTGTAIRSDPEGHTNEIYYGIEQIGWNLQGEAARRAQARLPRKARPAADVRVPGTRDVQVRGHGPRGRLPPRRKGAVQIRCRRRACWRGRSRSSRSARCGSSCATCRSASTSTPRSWACASPRK